MTDAPAAHVKYNFLDMAKYLMVYLAMIKATQYKIRNIASNEEFYYTTFDIPANQLALINQNVKTYEVVEHKDATLPTYAFSGCYECISIADIRKIIDNNTAEGFRAFMEHQTVPIIANLSNIEQDFCYLSDWINFLSGGRMFWD